MIPGYIKIAYASKTYSIPLQHLYWRRRKGKIRLVPVGGTYLVNEDDCKKLAPQVHGRAV